MTFLDQHWRSWSERAVVLLAGVALMAASSACGGEAAGETPASGGRRQAGTPERALTVVRAEPVEYRARWEVRGVLEPVRTARAAFILGGRLSKVFVERGEEVAEGQELARLDTAEVGAGVAQARAALAAASAQVEMAADALRRLERLEQQEAIAQSEVTKVRHQYEAAVAMRDQARAAVRMANVKSSQHVLRSPIAGTVLSVPERVGEIIGPGIPQFEIASLDRLRFEGTLPEAASGQVRFGQEVLLRRRFGAELTGRVTYLSPVLTSDTHRLPFEVEVTLPRDERQGVANSFVRAVVEAADATTVARIPSTAVVRGETTTVFVVDGQGRARRREVEVVRTAGEYVLVTGIEPTASLVDLPPVDLEDGAEAR